MKAKNEFDDFIRLLQALEPWLPQIVIVGGWAHRLYRFHELAQPLEYKPLLTFDTDVAVPKTLPVEQENIAQRLHQRGFTESFLGDNRPPVTQYRLGSESDGFYAEFLTPLDGDGQTRDGRSDPTVRIAGVSSQKLRYLDVLLQHSWPIALVPSNEIRIEKPAIIYVANPTAFIAQKLLIRERRDKAHIAKDVLYIHDTIELFGAKLEALNELWNKVVLPSLHRNHVARLRSSISTLFSDVNDTTRDAALIARAAGRVLNPDELWEACSAGLDFIFHGRSPENLGPSGLQTTERNRQGDHMTFDDENPEYLIDENPEPSPFDEFLQRDQDGGLYRPDPRRRWCFGGETG